MSAPLSINLKKKKMSTTSSNNNTKDKKITAEQTIILIRLIKKYKTLWNPDHPDFRSRIVRNYLYKKIGLYFQLTGEDVRRKFRRFRNCYRHELKQIQNKQKPYSSLFYFDEMEFLREQIEQRRLSASLSVNEDGTDTGGDPADSFEELYTIESVDTLNKQSPPEIIIEELQIDEMPAADAVEEHNEENSNLSEEKNDEFDIFAGYLASQLREMDKLSALETMEELQQIISQKRIGILKKDFKRKVNPDVQYRYSLKKNKDNT